jgi:hypothetical protein
MVHLFYSEKFETRKYVWPILAAIAKGAMAAGKTAVAAGKTAVAVGKTVGEGVAAIKSVGGGDSSDHRNTSLMDSMMEKSLKPDTGFYGHNKVEGGKQDTSGFYKHQKKVGQTLF